MNAKASIAFGSALLMAALQAGAATLPAARTQNGVAYLTGGIGEDEASAMRAEARRYPVSMFFTAGKDNAFLADVKVTVKDKAGKEVLSTAAGPILLVNVPSGSYTVTAKRDSKVLHRTVHVGKTGGKQLVFHWPQT
ncbi:MAG TPA: carboxypeptidase regulatory-like domain-containing protein [Burkholderiales bacterium]|nr:carboxypeptidase regulatory-like domain-containing protein [Burkholderiales bacterium]